MPGRGEGRGPLTLGELQSSAPRRLAPGHGSPAASLPSPVWRPGPPRLLPARCPRGRRTSTQASAQVMATAHSARSTPGAPRNLGPHWNVPRWANHVLPVDVPWPGFVKQHTLLSVVSSRVPVPLPLGSSSAFSVLPGHGRCEVSRTSLSWLALMPPPNSSVSMADAASFPASHIWGHMRSLPHDWLPQFILEPPTKTIPET